MKRVSAMAVAVLLSLQLLSGCSGQQSRTSVTTDSTASAADTQKDDAEGSDAAAVSADEPTDPSDPATEPIEVDPDANTTMAVLDVNSRQLGEIKLNGTATMTDQGIFYMAYSEEATDETTDETDKETIREFYLYRPLENRTVTLGTMKNMSYETDYARTEVGDKLYTLAITGDMSDEKDDPLWLLEFDLVKGEMHRYKISENGFAYAAMTAVNDKLLILNHDRQDYLYDKLIEFDTNTRSTKQILNVELNDEGGETLRQVYADGENIYVLRLYIDEEENVKAFVDTYNTNYEKQDQQNITMMMVAATSDLLMADEIFQEMRQMVSRFIVNNGKYIHYENFSITHFFGDMTTDELIEESSEALFASMGSGKPFYYLNRLLLPEQEEAQEPEGTDNPDEKAIELLEWDGEGFSATEFIPSDSRYELDEASRSPGGSILLTVRYKNPDDPNDTLPALLYYLPAGES